jgi:hypothetical protein
MNKSLRLLLTSTALALLGIIPATAQQITGTPGSPSATTTITRPLEGTGTDMRAQAADVVGYSRLVAANEAATVERK